MRGAHRSADHQGVHPLWGAVCNITNSVGQNTNSVGQNTNSVQQNSYFVGQNYILSTECNSVQQNLYSGGQNYILSTEFVMLHYPHTPDTAISLLQSAATPIKEKQVLFRLH